MNSSPAASPARYLQFNPMIKPLLYFCVSVILFSCKSQSQPRLTKVQGLELYRVTTPMYFNFLRLQEKNIDSATILSHILIDNFLKIYLSDTTNSSVVDNLLACYKFNKDYENQIFWAKHQLLHNNELLRKKVYFENLAYAYVSLGFLDSSKLFFENALKLENQFDSHLQIVEDFKNFADNIYFNQNKEGLEILNKRITSTCQYSVDILKFILPYSKVQKAFLIKPFSLDTIIEREKNCR